MNTIIFWFSATGNSLVVAKQVKTYLGSGELFPMTQSKGNEALGYQRIFLVFPLYYLGMPALVSTFLNQLEIPAGSQIIALVTRGCTGMGGVCKVLKNRLNTRGSALFASAYLDMPNNDCTLFAVADNKQNQKRLETSAKQLARFMGQLQKGTGSHAKEPLGFLHNLRQKVYHNKILDSHKKFYVTTACTACGICVAICPNRKIDFLDGRPRWNPGCQECEACINLCPQKAVQYLGSKTEKKRRYQHPAISWKDIAQQQTS